MKITKEKLKEVVRQVVRQKLDEMAVLEWKPEPVEDETGLSQDEIKKQLDKEKARSKAVRAQKKRQQIKQTTRGMELECGVGGDEKRRALEDEDDYEDEDHLSRLEKILAKNENGEF